MTLLNLRMGIGYRVLTLWIIAHLGGGTRLDVDVHHAGPAFFLKPVFDGQEFFTLNKEEKPFIVTSGTGAGVFNVTYGPFHATEPIRDELIQSAFGQDSLQNSLGYRFIFGDLDISAHLVESTITQKRPRLQVLFHASQYLDYRGDSLYKAPINLIQNRTSSALCMRIYIKNEVELEGSCVLGITDNVCIAQLEIPLNWWSEKSQKFNVYYSVFNVNENKQCIDLDNTPSDTQQQGYNKDDQNQAKHDKDEESSLLGKRRRVSTITLDHGQSTYQELREDQNVLIYIPQRSYHAGAQVRVPVKLDFGSDLKRFEIRVKSRAGLLVVGAEARNPTRWEISQEHVTSDRRGTVIASLKHEWSSPSERRESVFDWIFEVEESPVKQEDLTEEDKHNLIFTISYQKPNKGEVYTENDDVRRKARGKVLIQYDNTFAIVPVIKTNEFVNTAMLTGSPQNHAMRIYAIRHDDTLHDVTAHTTCHSADDAVLKVAKDCHWVYLDGTESHGSSHVNMIAKFDLHIRSIHFRVWAPEMPLVMALSDDQLNQIKGWRVDMSDILPPDTQYDGPQVSYDAAHDADDDDVIDDDVTNDACALRFQQSIVEVYARFCVGQGDRKTFLANRKALFSVTHLVKNGLRVADERVALLRDNVVQGIQPGNTQIVVMSQVKGHALRMMASKDLHVLAERVTVQELRAHVLSGVRVHLVPQQQWNRTIVAKVITEQTLTSKDQIGIVDVSVEFSDGKVMPLHLLPPSDYILDIDSLNTSKVEVESRLSADTPRIRALNEGQGELLKISLEQGRTCRRRRSRLLAFSNVHVDIDFTLGDDPGTYILKALVPRSDMEKDSIKTDAYLEAQQVSLEGSQGLSALEIGVYVLLGVICLAIVVFALNCIVFVMRYRHKQKLPAHKRESVSNANDWVWIGRETLQRNAIQTDCQQALMSEHDFSVNKTVARFLLPSSGNSSKRSSALSTGALPPVGTTTGNATGTAGAAGPNSNRNSVVSTYKGSECSIRITPNPLSGAATTSATTSDNSANTVPRQKTYSTLPRPPMHSFFHHAPGSSSQGRYNAATCGRGVRGGSGRGLAGVMLGDHNQSSALSDIPSTSAMSASSSDDPGSFSSLPSRCSRGRVPTPLQQLRLAQVAQQMAQRAPLQEQQQLLAQAAAQIAEHEEDVANGNLTSDAVSVAWDYEATGMTYQQLMEYFDNLKESSA